MVEFMNRYPANGAILTKLPVVEKNRKIQVI
jgi:hypothetical protein